MSPLSSFKRLSVSSTKSTKSSNCSVPISGHPSPLDITFALSIQSSTPTSSSSASATSNDGGYAEMLEDDNMSWGTSRTSNPRPKYSKRRGVGFF